jgi:RNA polymerase sigma-70 factor (family 1)
MQRKQQFEMLFKSHYGQMLALAKILLKDDEEAKDVVSDVFTQVWEGTIDPYIAQPRGYLLTCVRNRCFDVLGHRTVKERVHQLLTLDSALAIIPMKDELAELQLLKETVDTRLTAKDRQVLLMKYEQKMKYREIADELNISEVAVYKHLSQALKTLKNCLNKG